MPAEQPLERLQDPYYAPWERIIDKLNGLLLAGRLREAVLKVPDLREIGLMFSCQLSLRFISRLWRRKDVRMSFYHSSRMVIYGAAQSRLMYDSSLSLLMIASACLYRCSLGCSISRFRDSAYRHAFGRFPMELYDPFPGRKGRDANARQSFHAPYVYRHPV